MTVTELADARIGWGAQPRMSALETIMWRADRHLPSPVVVLERLASAPDWDRLVEAHRSVVRAVPRLRQGVVEPPLGLGAPGWSEDPYFDLAAHLRRVRLPEGGGWSWLMAEAARCARAPFDRARPPWEAVLYEGLPDGEAIYQLKLHHSLTDGLGAAQLLERLHTRTDQPPAGDPPISLVPSPRAARTSGFGALADQFRSDVASMSDVMSDAAAAIGAGAVDAMRDPAAWVGSLADAVGSAVGSATRYGLSLRRMLDPGAPGSPLLSGRGAAWRFAAVDLPLAELRAAAKVAGATLHDAYLAGLLGGYRRYHAALGAYVAAIPMAVPISMRRPGDPGGGNRFVGARFAGPTGIADPVRRIQAVRELVLAARSEPAKDTLELFGPAIGRLPGAVVTRLMTPMTAGNDLQASFVPGARGPRYLAGARVHRIYPFAPLPGCPAMIALVTHGDVGCVGVNLDPAAITRPELFLGCLRDGLAEVLALQPAEAEPVIRS